MDETGVPIHRVTCCDVTDVCRRVVHYQLPDFEALTYSIVVANNALDLIVRGAGASHDQDSQNVAIARDQTAHLYVIHTRFQVAY